MISITKPAIDTVIFAIFGLILSFILVYPSANHSNILPNYTFNSGRIFTNIVVGGDVINPPVVVPIDPIVAPIPSITPAPPQTWPQPTNSTTNFSTNYPATNQVVNTNN